MEGLKRIGKCLVLCFCLLFTCAWNIKLDYEIDIKNNKSADFNVILGLDEEFIDALISLDGTDGTREYSEEERWQLLEAYFESEGVSDLPKEKGFSQTRYEENQYMGLKFTKKIKDIDALIGNKVTFDLNDFTEIDDTKLFIKEGSVYRTKLNLVSFVDEEIEFESKFVVTLPTKPLSHNASSVSEDGKTLTWNWVIDSGNIIEFEFKFSKLLLYIIIGVGILILGGAIWYVIEKRRGPKRPTNTVTTFDNTDNKKVIDKLHTDEEVKKEESLENNLPEQEVLELDEIAEEKLEVLTVSTSNTSSKILNPGEAITTASEETDNYESLVDDYVEEPILEEEHIQDDMAVKEEVVKEESGEMSKFFPTERIKTPSENKGRQSTFDEFRNIFYNEEPTGADKVEEPVVSSRFFAPADIPQPVVDRSSVTVENVFPSENNLPNEANFVESTGATAVSAEVLFPSNISQENDVLDLEKTTFANNLTVEIFQELDNKSDSDKLL